MIPISALCENAGAPTRLVRFCFTKSDIQLDQAAERLARFRTNLG
jgi:aspartate/methionine/tyrosine aminotransferase